MRLDARDDEDEIELLHVMDEGFGFQFVIVIPFFEQVHFCDCGYLQSRWKNAVHTGCDKDVVDFEDGDFLAIALERFAGAKVSSLSLFVGEVIVESDSLYDRI